MAHDTCDGCGQDYDFARERDYLCLYLTYPEANHILATCPHCERLTHIFIIPEVVMGILDLKLTVRIAQEPDPEIMQTVSELLQLQITEEDKTVWPFKRATEPDEPVDLPEPPRDWLMQLYDDLRHFDRKDCDCAD